MEKKRCSKCGQEKSVSEFYKKGNGFEGMCKECRKHQNKNRYTYICEFCGEEFKTGNKNQKTCSKKCSTILKYPKIYVECEICKKKIKKIQRDIKRNKHHYCSNKCRAIGVGKFQCGKNNPNYGKGDKIRGKNHFRYNPNITQKEREVRRHYSEYHLWKKEIFRKFDYTCQCCLKRGGDMEPHHLDGYNKFKEKRTDVNNGVLLCVNCHKEFHKIYGYGNNTLEQFKEFYKNKTNKKFEVVRV
ncbi:MAG: HNH endonuclease signature motif containing protein [Clostridium perfringens]|nr:HNH endonuclease signature motif containing protein [Clostridium perfringens]